jgi:hypothetical protein
MRRGMTELMLALALLAPCSTTVTAQGAVPNEGADVILGILDNLQAYKRANGMAALAATTISCNVGNKVLNWRRLPNNQHPVISTNLYRLSNGRLQQIGQSWVKHGFLAVQGNLCQLAFPCQPHSNNQGLGIGCSDPYDSEINQGPDLGARSQINPTTGYFNGLTAAQHNHPEPDHPAGTEHGLEVRESDLGVASARYFLEGHYITPDDAAAGNALNNTSYREVTMRQLPSGEWQFENRGNTIRQRSAVEAWKAEGAILTYLDTVEAQVDGKDIKSRIAVAHRVISLGGNANRYEYLVYNMNSDRGVRSFSVPIGATPVRNVGFASVRSNFEGWSNDPWIIRQADGVVSWSTKSFTEDANANAIRWGTSYNFWFEADAPPLDVQATLERFKPGTGSTLISTVKGPGT